MVPPARADEPGRHPHYVHALADLRAARWLLSHRPGEPDVRAEEDRAIHEIEEAYHKIAEAAITDGKDIDDHTGVDVPPERGGRLHRAAELLRGVLHDVDAEEDDPRSRGLKHNAREDVDDALHATERAIHDVEAHHG